MKYHIITFGCQMNHSDSERIAALLRSQGHKPARKMGNANLLVINACSVRQSAIHRVYDKINKYHKNKKIILAGCVLESDKKKLQDKVVDIWHPDEYFKCVSLEQKLDTVKFPRSSATKKVQRSSAFVPIMTGCNNFCSYCIVPYTRGREKSRPADEIIKEVKNLIKNGYKEILLLGQNVNSYCSTLSATSPQMMGDALKGRRGVDDRQSAPPPTPSSSEEERQIDFPALLRLINALPGDFTVKFLSSHPKDMSGELIDTIAKCKKVSKEIHLPIQSGDNAILRKMNRKYTVAHYKKLIKKIRQKMPGTVISTDVIIGFPNETKKQFENTVKLFKEIKFAKAYISIYSPRPGTTAYKLRNDVPIQEKKRRWKILDEIANK
ncbi:MAG: radical SAM protein [Candidatus Portnoybacteria bacterium]|nr:radical SAM protein [Candidatus Portnoybacteria bacterium]